MGTWQDNYGGLLATGAASETWDGICLKPNVV